MANVAAFWMNSKKISGNLFLFCHVTGCRVAILGSGRFTMAGHRFSEANDFIEGYKIRPKPHCLYD